MKITRKDQVAQPFISPTGEQVFEMIGCSADLGGANAHSFAHVVIPSGNSSQNHYHPVAEETYYILAGQGRMVVDGEEHILNVGDAILIMPPEKHQIFPVGANDLEFLVVCAPAWEPSNSVYLDKE